MADFIQLPGTLNFRVVFGDEVNTAINLNRNISGYAFSTVIYRANVSGGGGGDGSVTTVGQTITQPTVGVVSASTGELSFGLTEAQTLLLTPGVPYRWYLRAVAPGDVTRTLISGDVVTVAP